MKHLVSILLFLYLLVVSNFLAFSYGYQKCYEELGLDWTGQSQFTEGFELGKVYASPVAEVELTSYSRLQGVRFHSPVKFICNNYSFVSDCDIPVVSKSIVPFEFRRAAVYLLGSNISITNCYFESISVPDSIPMVRENTLIDAK